MLLLLITMHLLLKVQQNKQQLSAIKRKVGDAGVEDLRPGEPPAKINSRWTNEELLMAVTAVRKYGMKKIVNSMLKYITSSYTCVCPFNFLQSFYDI